MTEPIETPTSSATDTDTDELAEADGSVRPPVWSLLPSLRATGTWLVLTGLAVALDGWTGLIVGVGIAAAVLAGVRPRTLTAAGVVCSALVPVWFLAQGSIAADDISPALVTESLVPHHLAFAAVALLVASVALTEVRSGRTTHVREVDGADSTPERSVGPLGAAGDGLRWAVVAVAVVLAVAVCVVAWLL